MATILNKTKRHITINHRPDGDKPRDDIPQTLGANVIKIKLTPMSPLIIEDDLYYQIKSKVKFFNSLIEAGFIEVHETDSLSSVIEQMKKDSIKSNEDDIENAEKIAELKGEKPEHKKPGRPPKNEANLVL